MSIAPFPLALATLTTLAMLDSGLVRAESTAKGPEQSFPNKSLHIIVGQTGGSVSDMIAHMLAKRFTESFKQYAIVENHAGEAGSVGARLVVRAPPDGYTLLLSSAGPIVINPLLRRKLDYDPARALVPIGFLATSPLLLVAHPSVPVANVKELIAFAKKHPDRLRYGAGEKGTPSHLTAELFKSMAGTRMVHVPFSGSAPSVDALMSARVDLSFATIPIVLPELTMSRLHALAVTSPQRSATVPHIPTIAEAGLPGFESQQWFALFGPAAMPQNVIHKLNGEILHWLRSPELRKRLAAEGAEPGNLSLEQFTTFIRTDAARWSKVIKASGATVD